MPTFGAWEDTVLEHTFDHVEYISLHTYLNNYADDTPAFLASPDLMDNFIEEVVAIADAVAARRRSPKRIMLSFDEWNVWYRTRRNRAATASSRGWPVAPPILEEVYNMRGRAGVRRRLHLAAQPCRPRQGRLPRPAGQRDRADHDRDRRPGLAPDDLPSLRRISASLGRGRVLRAADRLARPMRRAITTRADRSTSTSDMPAVPYLKLAAVHDDKAGTLTLFALNRSLTEELPLRLNAAGFSRLAAKQALQLCDPDLKAVNTKKIRTASRRGHWLPCAPTVSGWRPSWRRRHGTSSSSPSD